MTTLEYIGYTLSGLFVLQAIVSILYPLVVRGYNISFRQSADTLYYQKKKYKSIVGTRWDGSVTFATLFFFDVLIGASIIGGGIFALTVTSLLLYPLMIGAVLGAILGFPYVLRYFVDIFKALRMNSKTGDSERLAEIEKEMVILREKLNNGK